MRKGRRATKIGTVINLAIIAVFAISSVVIVGLVRSRARHDALSNAEQTARIILDRNLAIHGYFSTQLKPAVFSMAASAGDDAYFDPTWMSSTFAVREIDKIAHTLNPNDYYYKECAINARSPENEADEFERAFIERLNKEPDLQVSSEVRVLEGSRFFTVLRRGEVMDEGCLRCHSTPVQAPQGLVDRYGPVRSFNRSVNEVVSAISIRVPLDAAYADADRASLHVSMVLVSVLIVMLLVVMAITNRMIFKPLDLVKEAAVGISASEEQLGNKISAPFGKELEELTEAFNRMSTTLKEDRDALEHRVQERTVELRERNADLHKALEDVKTLSGLLPICASCKKIRDDQGYWERIESFVSRHSGAQFSHGICPDCAEKLYPGYLNKKNDR